MSVSALPHQKSWLRLCINVINTNVTWTALHIKTTHEHWLATGLVCMFHILVLMHVLMHVYLGQRGRM